MNRHTDINTPSQRQPGIKMNEHTHPDKRQGRTAYQTGTFEKVAQVGWTMKQLQKIYNNISHSIPEKLKKCPGEQTREKKSFFFA